MWTTFIANDIVGRGVPQRGALHYFQIDFLGTV